MSLAPEYELLKNIEKLHTTELGILRIKRNLVLETENVIEYCKEKIISHESTITRRGKNWYIEINNSIITVNAHSYTIITAHKNTKNTKN